MIRNNKQWSEYCHSRGTSGDQVFQILQDWRESEGIINHVCEWKFDNVDEEDRFNTGCGYAYFAESYWPSEDGLRFCPFCGDEIVVERIGDM